MGYGKSTWEKVSEGGIVAVIAILMFAFVIALVAGGYCLGGWLLSLAWNYVAVNVVAWHLPHITWLVGACIVFIASMIFGRGGSTTTTTNK